MAEGRFDEFEMGDLAKREEKYQEEYDDLDNEDLNEEYNRLEEERRRDPLDGNVLAEMAYINTLWDSTDPQGVVRRRPEGRVETSFGGVIDDVSVQLDKFTQGKFGVRSNHKSIDFLILRSRVYMKNGNIMFREELDNGELSMHDKIVVKRNGDSFEYTMRM